MFRKNSKYKGTFLILFTALLTTNSIMKFYYFNEKKDGMEMIGGIVFGVMAIIYATDIYEFYKNKKSLTKGHE